MYNRSITFKALFRKPRKHRWRYYRQAVFNQLNNMVPYVDLIGHSVASLWEIYVLLQKYVGGGITSISSPH